MSSRISSLLVQRNLLSVDDLINAIVLQAVQGGTLDTILLEHAQVAEATLVALLSEVSEWGPAAPTDPGQPDPALSATLPLATAVELALCPIARRGGELWLLCSDATDAAALARQRDECAEVIVALAGTELRVEQARALVYGQTLSPRFAALLERYGPLAPAVAAPVRPTPPAADPAEVARGGSAAPSPATGSGLVALSTTEAKALRLAADDLAILPGTVEQEQPTSGDEGVADAPGDAHPSDAQDDETAAELLPDLSDEATPVSERVDALAPTVARQFIEQATNRDDVLLYLLRGAHALVPAVQIFAARGDHLQGVLALNDGELDHEAVRRRRVPLELRSALTDACRQLKPYLGTLGDSDGNATALLCAEVMSSHVALVPIAVGDKLICLLIGHDPCDRPLAPELLAPLEALAQTAAAALGRLIAEQRRQSAPHAAVAEPKPNRPPHDPRTPADEPRSTAPETIRTPARPQRRRTRARVAPAPVRRTSTTAPGATAATPEPAPASDLPIESLVATLAERTHQHEALAAELRRRDATALAWLMERFPGAPAAALAELPELDEAGPVIHALAVFGRRALPRLVPELLSADQTRRLYATLLLGALVDGAAIALLAARLRDASPLVRRVACRALLQLRRDDQVASVRDELRVDLAHPDPQRQSVAMVALGALGDHVAAPSLIALLRDAREEVAQAAQLALTLLTKQDFQRNVPAWTDWWSRHRSRPSTEWLIETLTHPVLELREAAALELRESTGGDLAYDPKAPTAALLAGQERWRRWWTTQQGHRPPADATRGAKRRR